jgi:energy-coupling factor transport system permease protein
LILGRAAFVSVRRTFNTRTWAVWVLAAALPALLTRHPFYLLIALLVVAVVQSRSAHVNARLPVWRLGALLIFVATVWNALTAHFGETIVLYLPDALPLIGGRITLEAIVFGLCNGLAIWLLLAAFTTFNTQVTPYQVLSLAPRALRHAGLVVSIALTFFPQVLRTARQLNEAQAVRGYRVRRVRDLGALWVPLLLNALEDAAQLSEAMEARGYGRASDTRRRVGIAWAALLIGVLMQLYWRDASVGWIVIAISLVWLIVLGRNNVHPTRYRREGWSMADALVVAACIATFASFLLIATYDPSALAYTPYPRLTLPPLDVPVVIALLALLAPVFNLGLETGD